MSTVTTGYFCDVCGAPANSLYAIFGEETPIIPAGVSSINVNATQVKEAYCEAHVPADWHIGEERELPPLDQAQP